MLTWCNKQLNFFLAVEEVKKRCRNANFTKSQHFPDLTICVSWRVADSRSLSGTDLGSVVSMSCPQT